VSPVDILTQLAPAIAERYAIEREIGRGGMATVYLARDVRHDRKVALKVLDPELGAVLGVDRFLAEIRVTANLQHPNLLPLFDSGSAGGLLYYVMPFVEGESLRARLDHETQLPVEEAVAITAAIANALQYAHEHGVVHRDLKPENVLMQAGEPIVADFGIALAVSRAGGARVTQTGLSLGTPQYMSPEQATGDRTVDGRSDIYSLGAIAYEMLTGEPPHTGNNAQAVMARLLTEAPRPVRTARPAVPEHIDVAVQRALEKLPADRWSSAATFRGALLGQVPASTPVPSSRRATHSATILLAAVTTVAVAALAWVLVRDASHAPATPQPRVRFTLPDVPSGPRFDAPVFALADDGSAIAFAVADSNDATTLWVRRFDQPVPRQLAGTEGAASPFWSPDGKSVGFFANGRIERYNLGESAPTTVATIGGSPGGATWMPNGDIVASPGQGPLLLIPAAGGTPRAITALDSAHGELQDVSPERLPDGKHFMYTAISYSAAYTGGLLYVSSVDGGKPTLVRRGSAVFAAPDHLLARRDADLIALPFNPKTFSVGTAQTVVLSGEPAYSTTASASGTIAWVSSEPDYSTSLELMDRSGHTVRVLGPAATGVAYEYYAPRLSHDGRTVAAEHHLGQGGGDIYLFDVATGDTRRETFDPKSHSGFVAWSPDDKRIVFNTTRGGGGTIFMKTIGESDERTFVASVAASWPSDWSADGKYILFDRPSVTTQSDVWLAPAAGGTPKPILATPANEMQAALSPDGKWIAYASDEENGKFNVYVRRFPLTAEQWKVSEDGGEAPRWRGDGKELFFIVPHDRDVSMMSASIAAGDAFRAGKPMELFRKPIDVATDILRTGVYYDVTPDGKEFVAKLKVPVPSVAPAVLHVFVNALGATQAGGRP
jgi:serine/threonine-protein kinase